MKQSICVWTENGDRYHWVPVHPQTGKLFDEDRSIQYHRWLRQQAAGSRQQTAGSSHFKQAILSKLWDFPKAHFGSSLNFWRSHVKKRCIYFVRGARFGGSSLNFHKGSFWEGVAWTLKGPVLENRYLWFQRENFFGVESLDDKGAHFGMKDIVLWRTPFLGRPEIFRHGQFSRRSSMDFQRAHFSGQSLVFQNVNLEGMSWHPHKIYDFVVFLCTSQFSHTPTSASTSSSAFASTSAYPSRLYIWFYIQVEICVYIWWAPFCFAVFDFEKAKFCRDALRFWLTNLRKRSGRPEISQVPIRFENPKSSRYKMRPLNDLKLLLQSGAFEKFQSSPELIPPKSKDLLSRRGPFEEQGTPSPNINPIRILRPAPHNWL